jgi:hypothetical protein
MKQSNGFKYAGLVYYGNCICGTVLPPSAPEADCNASCNGNAAQTCGQNQRISIWQDPTYPSVDLSTIASQYAPLGCYTEGTGYRAVTYRQDQLSSTSLTTEACLAACGNQYYPLAATEYGGECYCGSMLQGGSAAAASGDCNMACTGDATEICGGPSRLNLYEAKILESTQPCGSNPPPPPSTCGGTAYGYATSSGQDKTFISLGIGKNWGWVITGSVMTQPISGNLYLGAGGNDLSKATIVGSFTIQHVGSKLIVTYNTQAPWYLSATHFYYGSTYPSKIAPGQFGYKHDSFAAGSTIDTFSIPYDSSKTTYIVHAAIGYAC